MNLRQSASDGNRPRPFLELDFNCARYLSLIPAASANAKRSAVVSVFR